MRQMVDLPDIDVDRTGAARSGPAQAGAVPPGRIPQDQLAVFGSAPQSGGAANLHKIGAGTCFGNQWPKI
jgi:hypothetical protein